MTLYRLPKFLAYLLHGFMLSILSGAFIPLWQEMRGNSIDVDTGDPITQILLLIGYAVTLLIILLRPRYTFSVIKRMKWIWLLIGLAFLSFIWSNDSSLTFRRSIAALLTSLYAILIFEHFKLANFIRLLGLFLLSSLVASLVMIIAVPSWGVMSGPNEGAWRGIYIHKNTLGLMSVLGLLVFIFLLGNAKKVARSVWVVGLLISICMIVGSRSATALVASVVIVVIWIVLRSLQRFGPKMRILVLLILTIMAVFMGVYIYNNVAFLFHLLGRDLTLTGRVQLWQLSLNFGFERPVLGWGYGAFWVNNEYPSGIIWEITKWKPQHAHNGYLDLFLNLGIVGLSVGMLILIIPGFSLLRILIRKIKDEDFILILLLFYLGVINLTESLFLRQNSLLWVMMVLLYLFVPATGEAVHGLFHKNEVEK